MRPRNDVSVERLRECFDLDAKTGVLTWRIRPREHFKSVRGCNQRNARFAGKVAGSPHNDGRLRVRLTFPGYNRLLLVHRIIFALVHDRWPLDGVDHVHGLEAGNGIDNLREATKSQNQQNQSARRNNISGLLGATPCPNNAKGRPWRAQIKINGRNRTLGYFATPEGAHARYLEAKAELHPFQPTPR